VFRPNLEVAREVDASARLPSLLIIILIAGDGTEETRVAPCCPMPSIHNSPNPSAGHGIRLLREIFTLRNNSSPRRSSVNAGLRIRDSAAPNTAKARCAQPGCHATLEFAMPREAVSHNLPPPVAVTKTTQVVTEEKAG
jgi:hypothetical protein